MVLHPPTGPLETCSGLELVPRCEPSTYKPISLLLSLCAIRTGMCVCLNVFVIVYVHETFIFCIRPTGLEHII